MDPPENAMKESEKTPKSKTPTIQNYIDKSVDFLHRNLDVSFAKCY